MTPITAETQQNFNLFFRLCLANQHGDHYGHQPFEQIHRTPIDVAGYSIVFTIKDRPENPVHLLCVSDQTGHISVRADHIVQIQVPATEFAIQPRVAPYYMGIKLVRTDGLELPHIIRKLIVQPNFFIPC